MLLVIIELIMHIITGKKKIDNPSLEGFFI